MRSFPETDIDPIPLHVIDNLIFRGFVSEAGLKFQPDLKFSM